MDAVGLGVALTTAVVLLAVGDEPGEPVSVSATVAMVVDEELGVVAEAGALLAPADDPLVLAPLPPTMKNGSDHW